MKNRLGDNKRFKRVVVNAADCKTQFAESSGQVTTFEQKQRNRG
jgi:hypothetical protein